MIEWRERGGNFSREDCRGVGAFREWWQRSDWVLREFFGLPSPLDGHSVAQKRAAKPSLSWLRLLYIKLKEAGLTQVRGLTATEIVEFCEFNEIETPCRAASEDEKTKQAQCIGRLLGPLFTEERNVFEGEGFKILRIEEPYYDEANYKDRTRKRYLFFEGERRGISLEIPAISGEGPLK